MIVIQSYDPAKNRDGEVIAIDAHRSVAVFVNEGSYWIDILNGERLYSFVLSRDAAEALATLLAIRMGWVR